MKQYKITLSKQEKRLLTKYGHLDAVQCDGSYVSKKTYMMILDLIKSVNKKEYGTGHTA